MATLVKKQKECELEPQDCLETQEWWTRDEKKKKKLFNFEKTVPSTNGLNLHITLRHAESE